ncbi:hypothetical protein ABES02_08745 [Neobacillus pocheonensis]|uniref:hypothetical protein n=1 Tax=Neobacillus pocheonensis TaxID=363869 RepID=UPI003D29AF6C
MHQPTYSIIIIGALILFSIFRRVRRTIGWQKLNQGKLLFRTILFLAIGLIFLGVGVAHPINLISDILGIVIGIILAYYGAGMTKFEKRNESWYFLPNIWIGSLVTAIFFARLIYRIYGIYSLESLGKLQEGQANSFQNIGSITGNSWTSGLMLIMFAYYALYYIIILRKQKKYLTQSAE